MTITAAMVKELRDMTGAGVMACKKALTETDGNMDEAVKVLREKGEATAEKKASRIAAEGTVMAAVKGETLAAIVEVNSETDFVAKNEKFRTFVNGVADTVLDSDAADVDALLTTPWIADPSKTVREELVSQIAVIGENMTIRRFAKLSADNGIIVPYIHGGGRIGVLVQAETDVVNAEVKEALKNVAMQVAAMNAKYVSRDEVDQEYIENEKAILTTAAKNEKPDANEKIISGMVMGRINKELKEICLLDQVYVKAEDGKQSVGKYVEQVAKEVGANLKVVKFVRFETGEGLEKKNEDFAAEVAKQMAQ